MALSEADVQALLGSDQLLRNALEAINSQRRVAESQLTAARQAALIRYGLIPPSIANDPAWTREVITDDLRRQVEEATRLRYSDVGQARLGYQTAQSQMTGQLGERGIIRSAAYGQHQNENLLAQALAIARAGDVQTGAFNTATNAYLDLNNSLVGMTANAWNSAYQRLIDSLKLGSPAAPDTLSPQPIPGGQGSTEYAPQGITGSGAPSLVDQPTPDRDLYTTIAPQRLSPYNINYQPPTPTVPHAAPKLTQSYPTGPNKSQILRNML